VRAAQPDIQPTESHDQKERRPDEGDRGEGGPADAGPNECQPHRELGRERTRRHLGDRQTVTVFLRADPLPLLDEVALHVPGERDGTAKSECSSKANMAESAGAIPRKSA
jgi:hypothetical protein